MVVSEDGPLLAPDARQLLAEPRQELEQIAEVHPAVAVIVEVPQVIRVALMTAEGAQELEQVVPVYVPVTVGVAEQAEQSIDAITTRLTDAGAVQCVPEVVVDEVAVNGQGVVAIGQRTADDAGPRESERVH